MNDDHLAEEPILVSRKVEEDSLGYLTKPSIPVSSAKWIIKVAILVIFIAWAGFIFLFPLQFMNDLFGNWILATEGTLFGVTGSYFLLFSGPIFIIAFLAIAHLIISGKEELHHNHKRKNSKHAHFSLWTFPVLVDGPFGVVSAAEMIGILLFYVYIIWAVSIYTVRNFQSLSMFDAASSKERSALMLEMTSVRLALTGLMCLAFLFLPIARGSVLLQFMGIPFEHATKYHVWLGHLTMLLFTLHGLFFVIAWAIQGRLLHELKDWKNEGIAILPGVISLSAGLMMWVTSIPGVRRINFELFFYTHQLYVVFIVFLALHVGDFFISMVAAGIFLFMLDRFLRFCQS